jgi:hypothetical protein
VYPPFYLGNIDMYSQSHQTLFYVARQQVDGLLRHLELVLVVKMENREVEFRRLFQTYFVQQVRCLIRSHLIHEQEEEEAGNIKVKQVVQAMAASLYKLSWFEIELRRQKRKGWPDATFDWVSRETFNISYRDTPLTGTLSLPLDRVC